MTEQEARTKWCPMARSSDNGVSINRTDDLTCKPDKDCMCIASECMAWRWERDLYAEGYEPKEDHEDYDKGFCGLGGRI